MGKKQICGTENELCGYADYQLSSTMRIGQWGLTRGILEILSGAQGVHLESIDMSGNGYIGSQNEYKLKVAPK